MIVDYNFIKRVTCPPEGGRDMIQDEETKSERRMPWLPQAKKDAVSCENLRGLANTN